MPPLAQPGKNTRISIAFLDTAHEVLSELRSPTEILGLVAMALKVRPLRTSEELLGQEVYKLAKTGTHGFVVEEYPCFKLRKTRPTIRFPRRGYAAAALRVLSPSNAPRGHVDVREIAERAREAGILDTISPVPEYWMSVMIDRRPDAFSRSGLLKVGLRDLSQTPAADRARASRKNSQGTPSGSSLTERIYERDLESLVGERLDLLEDGLQLVSRQYSTPVGRIDLLCKDRRGHHVVVELKSFGARTNEIIDQVTRYMGYVKTHLATGDQLVRGIIIVGQVDDSLNYAVLPIPNLEIKTFELTISPAPSFSAS